MNRETVIASRPAYSNQALLRIGRAGDISSESVVRPSHTVVLRPKRAEYIGEEESMLQTKQVSSPGRHSPIVIGSIDDPAEREADFIADAILTGKPHGKPSRFAGTPIRTKGINGEPCSSSDGEREEKDEELALVQAKLDGGSSVGKNEALSARISARRGGGEGLPSKIGRMFERHLGVPLGGVRLHRDAEAGELTRSIGALAFTTGSDVYFAPGRYTPDTPSGTHLLAHELTHIAQQETADANNSPIRRYTLKGFDSSQETQMNSAVASAKKKMLDCAGKSITVADIADIVRGLDQADYVYVPDLKECGLSNPITDTIQIGSSAFVYSSCCDLDSTLAHECAHSFAWGFESFARKVECSCFGCSCDYKG